MNESKNREIINLARHIEILQAKIQMQNENLESVRSAFDFACELTATLQEEYTCCQEKLKELLK